MTEVVNMDNRNHDIDLDIHKGHRSRLKRRFIAEGLTNFEAHTVFEMILCYAIPRKDTNELAHRLLAYFGGSLSRVFDAPLEELQKVEGIGESAAVLIKLFPEVCRLYLADLNRVGSVIKNARDAAKILIPNFIGRTNEIVMMICIDAKGKVLFCNPVFEGSVNAAAVSVRRFVEIAVRYATTDVIMAHNHPGGVAIPSQQDIIVTKKVSDALKTVNIHLVDHLIVAGNDWVSLAETPSLIDIFPSRFSVY